MAHELTHALQDQHFNLRRFEKWPHGDSDAELAAHALIEGDATLAMTVYMAKNPLVALAFTRSLGSTALHPSNLTRRRARCVSRWFSRMGTARSGRPNSTSAAVGVWSRRPSRNCRYPASRSSIRRSISVTNDRSRSCCRSLRSLLGPGWKEIDSDVNGEWSYYLILDQFLNSPSESRRAAAGWAGDRYEIYEGAKPAR